VHGERASDEALAAAVEADLVEHVATLHEPPYGEVGREDGVVWFRTGRDDPNENGVLRAPLAGVDPAGVVARLVAPFADRALPMMWWVFQWGPLPAAVDRALRAHGLAPASDRPGMGLDLGDARTLPPLTGTTVERVRDPEGLRDWAGVVGRAFGDPAFGEGPSVAFTLARGFGDEQPFRHFVCRSGADAVGAATLSLCAPGVAGLANIATLPEWRGRGVGGTVASAVLDEARGIGIRTAALSSDELGVGLYRKLGFRTVCRHLTYVGRPSPPGDPSRASGERP
jgi:ribosomal protein S18 acetylase RimI-like enzyme